MQFSIKNCEPKFSCLCLTRFHTQNQSNQKSNLCAAEHICEGVCSVGPVTNSTGVHFISPEVNNNSVMCVKKMVHQIRL